MPNRDKLDQFTAWCQRCLSGDEKGQAQIFLDRLFQAFGQAGSWKQSSAIASGWNLKKMDTLCIVTFPGLTPLMPS